MYIVTAEQVRRLVPIGDAIRVTKEAFIAASERRLQQPQRLSTDDGSVLAMVARVAPATDTVVKIVSVYPHNRSSSLPTIHSTVLWLNGNTGELEALIEGSTLTAIRTGAASGVAADILARRDASSLTMIGAGRQAPDQIRAICTVRDIRTVHIVSRSKRSSSQLADQMAIEMPAISFDATTDLVSAVGDADIIACATTSLEPVFDASYVKPGTHVIGVGSYAREMQELPAEVFGKATVVAVDQLHASSVEAGDLIAAIEKGYLTKDRPIELGTLLKESYVPPGGAITIFKSVGIAAQDWMLANLVMERVLATTRGLSDITLLDA
ncbi:MAG: ornithine cyclodeaminase family protein [Vulcanimicrobiaceae bacterium]